MVASGLCYVLLSWCVKQRGPVFTAAFTPLLQIFVAMFDFSVLHEQIHLGRFFPQPLLIFYYIIQDSKFLISSIYTFVIGSILGSILVITGLYILLWGKSKEEEKNCVIKQSQVAEEDVECDMASQAVRIAGDSLE